MFFKYWGSFFIYLAVKSVNKKNKRNGSREKSPSPDLIKAENGVGTCMYEDITLKFYYQR